ncbi:macrolide family glycosyltransferase [Antrihabitans spumae]|uniref:Macrolide family glycosyltransferase n=1 Tax=Antrihabitans spumae TaxID=3373370 RepID=A0ABW7KVD2_9NOCA
MNRSHIAIVSIPASGHCIPIQGIIAELTSRGHRVTFASGQGHVEVPESLGAETITYRTTLSSRRTYNSDTQEELEHMPLLFLKETMLVLPQLELALSASPPDLVIFDVMAWAGWMLAEKWKIPSVQSWPVFASNTEFSLEESYTVFDLRHPAMIEFDLTLKKFLQDEGFAYMTNTQFFNYTADRHIVLFPRSFQFEGHTFDERFFFVGPCGLSTVRGSVRRPSQKKTSVLISLGTAYNARLDFFKKCIAAFDSTEWDVTMTVGHRISVEDLGVVPRNFRVEPYIPHSDILEDVDVFVCQAGMGAMMEALRRKIPLVLLPQSPEQVATAQRAVQLDLGVRLADDCTADDIVEAVRRALADDVIDASVANFSAEIENAGGAKRAADVIERFLAETLPISPRDAPVQRSVTDRA